MLRNQRTHRSPRASLLDDGHLPRINTFFGAGSVPSQRAPMSARPLALSMILLASPLFGVDREPVRGEGPGMDPSLRSEERGESIRMCSSLRSEESRDGCRSARAWFEQDAGDSRV